MGKESWSADHFTLEGKRVLVSVSSEFHSQPRHYVGEIIAEESYYENKRGSLANVLRFLSSKLDGNPKIFGPYSLAEVHAKQAAQASLMGEGAEHLVAGILMLHCGLVATITSRNLPGFDLLVFNRETLKSARVQVKYRSWNGSLAQPAPGYDFLVLVVDFYGALTSSESIEASRRAPEWPIYVVPAMRHTDLGFGGPSQTDVKYKDHLHNWQCIVDYLR